MVGRVVSLLLASSAAASAQPASPERAERFAIGAGAVAGAGRNFLYGGLALEGGVAILEAPVRLRGRAFAGGGGTMRPGDGAFALGGAGVEARWCGPRGRLCGFAGVDLGYHAFWTDEFATEPGVSARGPFVGPRLGFEAGGGVRVRVALEYHRQLTGADEADQMLGLALGLAYHL